MTSHDKASMHVSWMCATKEWSGTK